LEPHIVKQDRGGLIYNHDMGMDRVIITQGNVSRQVGWWPREIKVVLPLSGMIHPDDIAEIQKLIEIREAIDGDDRKEPAMILDPGRNTLEQEQEEDDDSDYFDQEND